MKKASIRNTYSLDTGSGVPLGLVLTNTLLRPNWEPFWAADGEESESSKLSCESQLSSAVPETGKFTNVKFVTGSEWTGQWDKFGMSGIGTYKMPHGVSYEGTMNRGLMEGYGVLRYPIGGSLEGLWYAGELKYWNYDYADGLAYTEGDEYCGMQDRRFYSEKMEGMKPATHEQVSNEDPPKRLPPGCYHTGFGIYDPKTKCTTYPETDQVLNVPTVSEEKWIRENCRESEIDNVGYCPKLYENWFTHKNISGDLSNTESTECNDPRTEDNLKNEILKILKQEGMKLEPTKLDLPRGRSSRVINYTRHISLNPDDVLSDHFQSNSDSFSGKYDREFESFVKGVIKELDKSKTKTLMKPVLSEASLLGKISQQLSARSDGLIIGELLDEMIYLTEKLVNETYDISSFPEDPSTYELQFKKSATSSKMKGKSGTNYSSYPLRYSHSQIKLLSLINEVRENKKYSIIQNNRLIPTTSYLNLAHK